MDCSQEGRCGTRLHRSISTLQVFKYLREGRVTAQIYIADKLHDCLLSAFHNFNTKLGQRKWGKNNPILPQQSENQAKNLSTVLAKTLVKICIESKHKFKAFDLPSSTKSFSFLKSQNNH